MFKKEILLPVGLILSTMMLFSTAGNYMKVSRAVHSFTVQVSEDCRVGRDLEFTVCFTSDSPLEIRLPFLRAVAFVGGQYCGGQNYDWTVNPPVFSSTGGFTQAVRVPLSDWENDRRLDDNWSVELFGHFAIPGFLKESFIKRHFFAEVEYTQ